MFNIHGLQPADIGREFNRATQKIVLERKVTMARKAVVFLMRFIRRQIRKSLLVK